MRRLSLTAVAATAVIGAVGVAQAVTPTTSLKASVSPSKKGTMKKPRNVKLSLELITQPNPSDPAFATKSTVVHLDKNLRFGGKYVKTCTRAKVLSNNKACPKGSKVGSGSATAVAIGIPEKLTITAYNGPKGKAIELLVDALLPLKIHNVLEGTLSSDTGAFGSKLTVVIPAALQQPVENVTATLTDFRTVVKGTGSKNRPYVGLVGCKGGALTFRSDFVFSDDTTATAPATVPCS